MLEKFKETPIRYILPEKGQVLSMRETVLNCIMSARGVNKEEAEKIYQDQYLFSRPSSKVRP